MKPRTYLTRSFFLFLPLLLLVWGCKKEEVKPSNQFVDPRDGVIYKTVTIGSQTWMAENLKYLPSLTHLMNYDDSKPFYCVSGYSWDSVSAAKKTFNFINYGVAYNWAAAQTACPPGWHLPSVAEWNQLINYCGGDSIAGGKLKARGTKLWQNPNTGGTDEYGFNALPGGMGLPLTNGLGYNAPFWNGEKDTVGNYKIGITLFHDYRVASTFITNKRKKDEGFLFIRCVKD